MAQKGYIETKVDIKVEWNKVRKTSYVAEKAEIGDKNMHTKTKRTLQGTQS